MLQPTTPLAELCIRQAVDWQNKYLRYTWVTLELDGAELRVQEEALIRAHTPLLNRSAMPSFPPPQLRRLRRFERARARWLWHTGWAGLLSHPPLERPADWFGPHPQIRPGVDALGYPCRRDQATHLSPDDILPPENVPELMRFCARAANASVREAIRATRDEDELELWWSAHAGAPMLNEDVAIEDSLSASLALANEHEFPGPSKMPPEARRRELCKVGEKTFQRGYH